MATSKGKKVCFYTDVELVYRCGCRKLIKKTDKLKINVLDVDRQMEFASKIKCENCIK